MLAISTQNKARNESEKSYHSERNELIMRREEVINKILDKKIIAIIRGYQTDTCLRLAEALYNGGISLIEITFNQSEPETFSITANSIQAISEHFRGDIMIGAGTVLTQKQVDMATEAGAKYIISPNADPKIISYTRNLDLVSIPGALTPSEIIIANQAGADFIKLFPVGNLGSAYIKAIKAPISHINLLAVGGINEKNIKEFLSTGVVGVGVGGNLTNKEWIQNGEFDKITNLAKQYVCNAT